MFLIYSILAVIVFVIVVAFISEEIENKNVSRMTPIEKEEYLKKKELKLKKFQDNQNLEKYGQVNEVMLCPHCQEKGIRTKHIEQKKGISGAKATGAVLTGGLSLLAVGLSRKEGATQAHCDNCKNTWVF